ncbi:ABC transporter ATP-binding protein [Chitinophaga eiseniae]|nr:ABC transporter ATP-binding protein [Chitinophaga eiseniae]
MNRLNIDQLSVTYANGVKALQNISLDVSNGMFGLLGPNGAGKSTLMKTIVGLQRPHHGKITFNGEDAVDNPASLRKQTGFLPQDFGVYPKVSAYDLLQHLAVLKGVNDARQRKTQILDLLAKVNLYDMRHKAVHTFSGGMKQRFGVAQTLLGHPQMIIVDEPTAGLDPEERNRFNTLLSDISGEMIVILSTHLVEDVRNLCSRMAIIRQGRLLATGAPEAMIADLQGKVWTKIIPAATLPAYREHYPIIGQQLIAREMHISVYADHQPAGFSAATPTLEHVYFHTLCRSA